MYFIILIKDTSTKIEESFNVFFIILPDISIFLLCQIE